VGESESVRESKRVRVCMSERVGERKRGLPMLEKVLEAKTLVVVEAARECERVRECVRECKKELERV
jgi:hypothetical protein